MSGMNPNQMGMDYSQLFQPRAMPDVFKPSSMPWGQQVTQAFTPQPQTPPLSFGRQTIGMTGNGRGMSPINQPVGQLR